MNEEALFIEAMEIRDPSERGAFLDRACAGDGAVRGRLERLLDQHERAGSFMNRPVGARLVEDLSAHPETDDTRTSSAVPDGGDELDFLEPSDNSESLGRLGHYEVQEVVGRGGMGVVLKAFDENLHRVVAVKVMAPQLAASATARRRFTREARAAAAVTHDHVVTIHAVEDAGPRPYIVMQYVAGASLQDRIDRTGPLQLPEVLRIAMQTASGLAAAHAQGLVHRDVKPANILLENGVERVKITDFGLARAADDASLTQAGVVAGTPAFMSPEQAEGKPVDHRSDLFSLGSVLYVMCTGRPPFQAGSSIGVLKRVCEETPTPIRETNPEVPDWLAAVVENLHAKDPAGRPRSAAEVAEVLGQHLAHVQHPSVVPLPSVVKAAAGPPSPARLVRRNRWAVAAAVLTAVVATLGTTEATGVTSVRATVIRLFTPEGTLVVETDDPGVKVTVEGDGDLVITGAGPQEVRLRAGSYRLRATKDGQPVKLDRDLVTITRGDKQVVRVRLEGDAPAAAVPKEEAGAFVRMGGKEVAERKFNTLAEAVLGASDGDTIEIRGNGPFVSAPTNLGKQALTIRAGEGFRPVVRLGSEGKQTELPLLTAYGPLVLEGIEWQHPGGPHVPLRMKGIVSTLGPALHIANCRFVMALGGQMCVYSEAPVGSYRNCEFLSHGRGVWGLQPNNQLQVLDNCLHLGFSSLQNVYAGSHSATASIRLTRNTFVTDPVAIGIEVVVLPEPSGTAPSPIQMDVSSTIFDGPSALNVTMPGKVLSQETLVKPGYVEGHIRRMLVWRDQDNLYAGTGPALLFWALDRANSAPGVPRTLAEWKRFWGSSDAACAEGRVRYQGGNLFARFAESPDQLRPADFRLSPDSAGYRAGKDGKDLGADVDLVGPGTAYERWKKTPEYQQWLKDTGQLRAAAPKPEPKAFVLLGGNGVAERKLDTLAEAVLGASDGDTIEVRGNGPFVTEPVNVQTRTLAIRAGDGFRPVIRLSARATQAFEPMLSAKGDALVLEGIEFQRLVQKEWAAGQQSTSIIYSKSAALHIANCRFRLDGSNHRICVNCQAPVCIVRNCEFVGPDFGGVYSVSGDAGDVEQLRVLENCVHVGNVALNMPHGASVRLTRNTLVSGSYLVMLHVHVPLKVLEKRRALGPTRVEASGNVFDARPLLLYLYDPSVGDGVAKPADAEAILLRLLAWRDRGNLYREGSTSVGWCAEFLVPKVFPVAGKSPADWKRFWNDPQADMTEGRIRYQGGDLITRAGTAPDQLTPEDFRLRPDSAGYRAGKDKKDLGADVDLVGPGKGYERWKKTPEYQQWLEESGQLKK